MLGEAEQIITGGGAAYWCLVTSLKVMNLGGTWLNKYQDNVNSVTEQKHKDEVISISVLFQLVEQLRTEMAEQKTRFTKELAEADNRLCTVEETNRVQGHTIEALNKYIETLEMMIKTLNETILKLQQENTTYADELGARDTMISALQTERDLIMNELRQLQEGRQTS